jgi:6-phosphogluconolactonase
MGTAAAMAAVPLSSRKMWGAGMTRRSLWMGSCNPRSNKNGIYHAWFDAATGRATEPTLAAATALPSFLTTMTDGRGRTILYSVNELARGDGQVSAFVMDGAKGALTPINHVSAEGEAPCYLSARPSTRTLYSANYNGGSVSVYRAAADGALLPVVQKINLQAGKYGQPGPSVRQGTSHPHSTTLSPNGRFCIVNDLGKDSVNVFPILPDGRLDEEGVKLTRRPAETGPRHVAFHPNGKWVYGIDELNNTLQRYEWVESGATAELKPLPQSLSSMQPHGPAPVAGEPLTASEVAISADGRFLYACTRGDDSLTVFAIAKDGNLTFKQRVGSGGAMPRQFALDPTGGWIACCNNNSPAVTIFKRTQADGTLSEALQTLAVESPEFALFT